MSTQAAQAADQMQGEAIATSLDQITNFDNLFEPVEVGQGQPEAEAARERDATGKFTKAADDKADEAPEQTADTKTTEAKDKADDAAEEEEDYVEIPGEGENAQPSRLKLTEVLQGYQEREKLKAELQAATERVSSLPADVETKLVEAARARQQYATGLDQLQKWMQPQWPSIDLLRQDPDAYYAQYQSAEQVYAMSTKLAAEQERVAKETEEVDRTVRESRQRREWAEAVKVWPELKDQAVRTELTSWLKTEGYSDQDIDRIDSRDLKVIKRAFAYDKSQAARETVAKAVLAKPRVVRPQARAAPQTGRQASATEALTRLGKSGSVDDARAALEALL